MTYEKFSPLAFVESLSFARYGGTQEEKKAAALIAAEIEKAGGKAEIMPFEIAASTYVSHVTKVIAPFEMALDTVAFGMCGNMPAPGMDLKLFYA